MPFGVGREPNKERNSALTHTGSKGKAGSGTGRRTAKANHIHSSARFLARAERRPRSTTEVPMSTSSRGTSSLEGHIFLIPRKVVLIEGAKTDGGTASALLRRTGAQVRQRKQHAPGESESLRGPHPPTASSCGQHTLCRTPRGGGRWPTSSVMHITQRQPKTRAYYAHSQARIKRGAAVSDFPVKNPVKSP